MNAQLEWFKDYYQQVLSLAGEQNGEDIITNALYVIGTGSNDYVNNYFLNPFLMANYSLDQYQTFLLGNAKGYIQELYNLGGRKIAVLGLPPLGCLPSQITVHGTLDSDACVTEFNNVALTFNTGLEALINEMKPSMPGSRLFYVDIYSLLDTVYNNPTAYGFTETRKACCGTGYLETAILCNEASIGTCADAAPYLFWDSFHPTTRFYKMLADSLVQASDSVLRAPPQP
jgi:phospholipase/lecithinase/hemolysin